MGKEIVTMTDFDTIAELLEYKMNYWSFSRLLKEVYRGEEPLQRRLSLRLTEYAGGGRCD